MVKNEPPSWVKYNLIDYKVLTPQQVQELDEYIMSELREKTPRADIVAALGISTGQFDYRRQMISAAHPSLRGRQHSQDKSLKAANAARAAKAEGQPVQEEAPVERQDNMPAPARSPNPKYDDLSDEAIEAWPGAKIRHIAAPKPGSFCCWPVGEPGKHGFHFCNRGLKNHVRYCEIHVATAVSVRTPKINAQGGR
jgi:hypothetical protein